jgi:lactoylglutathione lyase
MAAVAGASVPIGSKYRANFQQSMLRIKDPAVSVPFYERHFGMKLVHKYDFPEFKFSLYFLERPREDQTIPENVPSDESEKYLWTMPGCTLELTHNHGSELDPEFQVWSGNHGKDLPESSPLYVKDGPVRGFGHIAFNLEDVYATSAALEEAGVRFQKRPDEGRMKGLAFALDPDGYWIELVQRQPGVHREAFNLSQTMMRVKDGPKTVEFYRDIMGMHLCWEMVIPGDFTNYFLANLSEEQKLAAPDPASREGFSFVNRLWQPALELTFNHGTEKDDTFAIHTGNTTPQGFGHIGFLVDDLVAMCKDLEDAGVPFFKKPDEGKMRGLAFVLDPNGYRVELIQRGLTIDKDLLAPAAS